MANKRSEVVSYRKFQAEPNLSEGLLGVAREGGDLERRVAQGLFRLADVAGAYGDRKAEALGTREGQRAAIAGAPTAATVSGGGQESWPAASPSGGASGGGAPAARAPGNARQVKSYLMEKHGFSDAQASAVTGHLIQESGLRSSGAVGDNGTAFGVAQWRNERFANLKNFAASRGNSWEDLNTQLDFVAHELNTSEAFAGNALRAAGTVDEATAAFMHFERPQGWSRANPRGGHAWSARLANAQGLFGGASVPASVDPVTTASTGAQLANSAPAVVPVSQPVSITPGKAGTFRPSERDTVYGRAFDAAGTRTYLQMLDTTMRSDISAVYEAAKGDPADLRTKLNALRTLHLDAQEGHVMDEIRPEYEATFARLTEPLVLQANKEAQQRQKEVDTVAFFERNAELDTDIARRAAAITPDNPLAASDLLAAQQARDDHYDSAVARNIMTPLQAQNAKAETRRDVAVQFYLRQADTLPSDKIAEMRTSMRADFAAGELEGIDGDGWATLEAKLEQLERSKRVEDNQAQTALTKRGNEFAARLAAGFEIDEAALTKFRLDASTASGGDTIVDETMSKINIARQLREMPLPEANAKVAEMRKNLGQTPTAEALRTYGYASEFLETKAKLLSDDPVSYVQNADPEVQAAWAAATAEDPQSYARAIDLTVRAQEKLGVSSPKILPKSVATSAVSQFKNNQLDDTARISAVTSVMFATDEPEQRRAIFNQMVGAGLDGYTEGAFNALDRGDPEAARRLFQASMFDPSGLPGKLAQKPGEIDEAIQDAIMADGAIGDIYYGLSSGTNQNYQQAQRDSTLIKRSVQFRLQSGEALDDAVAGVARDIYGDVVPVSTSRRVNAQLLLPRDQDAGVVFAGLEQMKSQVTAALEAAIAVPEGVKVSDGGKAVHSAVTQNHISSVLSEGVFRSAGDNFIFIDGYSGLAVPGRDGKPLTFTMREVVDAGTAARAEPRAPSRYDDLFPYNEMMEGYAP